MVVYDKQDAIIILIVVHVLLWGFGANVPQIVNAANIDIRVEAVGGALPINTISVGAVFNIYFRVNVQYTGKVSGTLGYSKCQGCPSMWQTNYPGIASGVEIATSTDQPINTVGNYVIFLYVTLPGSPPLGGAAIAGYSDFHVIPLTTATTAAGWQTDWAITSVSLAPSAPKVGDEVTFSMMMSALSSPGPFPQSFSAVCVIDGASCGSASLTYPGPTGTPFTVNAQTLWIATAGTHTLTWGIATIPVGLDPNKSNNAMSKSFMVASQSPISSTAVMSTAGVSTITTGPSSLTISVQTVMQTPYPLTSPPPSTDYMPIAIAIIVSAVIMGVALMRRRAHIGSTQTSQSPQVLPGQRAGGFCPSCGAQLSSDASFCKKCGRSVTS